MAMALPQRIRPLPDLGSINSNIIGHHDELVNKTSFDGTPLLGNDSAVAPETPTSSENATKRLDSVALLSRPVKGYHHPRHHLFTDRLIGRFFEDCSLEAETRKKNKTFAGRLSISQNGSRGRPSTTSSTSKTFPHLPSPHSSRRKCGKRVHLSLSDHALSDERQTMRLRISASREQVENEIMEQKALIEKLEGQMASLSSRVGRARHSENVDAPAAQESPAIDASNGSEVDIQGSLCKIGKRERCLSLCSTQQEFESHLQAMLCQTGALVHGDQTRLAASSAVIASIDRVSAAVELVLESSREADFAKPTFDTLRSLFSGMGWVSGTLMSLHAAARNDGQSDRTRQTFEAIELSFRAAKSTLETLREALGADAEVEEPILPIPSSTKDLPPLPAGSGRAAALAAASTRGGVLVSPEASNHQEVLVREQYPAMKGSGNPNTQQEERQQTRRVKLSTLDVEGIAKLLHANGFGEHAPCFISGAIDGVMLSDPNLCEADFLELGVGNDSSESDCRTRIVAFFQRCRREGVALSRTSQPVFENVTSFGPESSKQGEWGNRSGRQGLTGATNDVEQIERGKNLRSAPKRGPSRAESVRCYPSEAVKLRKQDVIFDILIDSNDGGTVAPAESRGAGRMMSIKLKHGVIVTADGEEVNVIQTVNSVGQYHEDGDRGEGEMPPKACYEPTAILGSRRTSLGIPAVSLESESVWPDNREPCVVVDEQIPPGVVVKTPDATLNVFP